MNHDNLSRRAAIMIDRETLHARQMRRAAPKKLRVHHLPARANPRSSPFGLAWRAATEQNRLWKPASGESRINGGRRSAGNVSRRNPRKKRRRSRDLQRIEFGGGLHP